MMRCRSAANVISCSFLLTKLVTFLACFFQTKTVLVDPIDYESVIAKNKTLLQNDPQREMLLFPHDDVSVSLHSSSHLSCSMVVCVLFGKKYDI